MAYGFTTKSGSAYIVRNGSIERMSDHAIEGAAQHGDTLAIVAVIDPATPGARARFDTREFGVFSTSPVVARFPVT